MRTPSKAEYNRALTELSATCMEPIHKERRGGLPSLFKEKHARLNDSEDKVCHAVAVVNAYVKALEDRCEAAESQVSEMVTGEGEVMAPMGDGPSHDNPTGDAVCAGCAGKKHKCKACEK